MKFNKKSLLVVGLVLLAVFYGFSRYVKNGGLKQLDFNTTVRMQNKVPVIERVGGDGVWEDITFFAGPEMSIVAVGILTIFASFDFNKKKLRWKAIVIPLCFGLLIVAELYGKSVVHHPAPPFFMLKNPTTLFPKYHVQEDFSYPSGHAARALFVAIVSTGLVLRTASKKIHFVSLFFMGGFVLIISLGKIYLGQHWLSDVIAGWLLGGGFGLLVLAAIDGASKVPYNT